MIVLVYFLLTVWSLAILAVIVRIVRRWRVITRSAHMQRERAAILHPTIHPSLWEDRAKVEEKAQAILRAAKGDR